MVTRHVTIDRCQLYLGDCHDVIAKLSGNEAVVTDPPYGMNWDTDSTRFSGGKGYHVKESPRIKGDDRPFDPSPWLVFPKVVLWGSNHFAQRLPVGTTLVWAKKSESKFGKFLSDCEIGWCAGGHGVYLFHHVWDGCARESENGQHYHPTQKPVALMSWAIDRAGIKADETVIDPFMGSGTTGVACVRRGLSFIGIEKDPAHFETAYRRIRRAAADERSSLFPANAG